MYRRYLCGLIGCQSNERGSGPAGSASRVGGVGAPYADPATRGWWPSAIESAGRRGVWLSVSNTAAGSTSLVESWVGRVRAWQSGQVYTVGGYTIQGGNVFKKTSASVQTSTTAPAAGTGADGITWALARAVTVADTDGAIYAFGDALYDPLGLIAAGLTPIVGKPGYDGIGVYTLIGQTDHTVAATRTQYGQALINLAAHVTGLGFTHWIGMTCSMSGADQPTIDAREATFTNVLLPGRLDALAALAGNPLVKQGANLRASLGLLTASAVDTTLNAVNNSDYLHMTSATYDQAGPYVDASLAAGGW